MTEVGIVFVALALLMCCFFHFSTVVVIVLVVHFFAWLADLLMSQSAFTLLPLTYSGIVTSFMLYVHYNFYNSCHYVFS